VTQVYVSLPQSSGEAFKRLVAWKKVPLAPGESQSVTLALDPHFLSIFNVSKNAWELLPGEYKVYVGGSSQDLPLSETLPIQNGL
jgi:beta-glucosidase